MSGWLDSTQLQVLEQGLSASNLRQKVLANNVANVETPGFKRSDVDFQGVLQSVMGEGGLELERTMPQHLSGIDSSTQPAIVTDPSSIQTNGNNVNIDREMTNVAENDIYYQSLSRAISSQFGILQDAIDAKG